MRVVLRGGSGNGLSGLQLLRTPYQQRAHETGFGNLFLPTYIYG